MTWGELVAVVGVLILFARTMLGDTPTPSGFFKIGAVLLVVYLIGGPLRYLLPVIL